MALRTYSRVITADMLDSEGAFYESIPAGPVDQQVVSWRVLAPELTGATTGFQWAGLVYRVGEPVEVIEAMRVAGGTPPGALAYTPGSYRPEASEQVVVGTYVGVRFGEGAPLYVAYQNTADVALPGPLRIDVVHADAL